jgi:hypothetical protein
MELMNKLVLAVGWGSQGVVEAVAMWARWMGGTVGSFREAVSSTLTDVPSCNAAPWGNLQSARGQEFGHCAGLITGVSNNEGSICPAAAARQLMVEAINR